MGALSHIKSNAIVDFTGTVTVFNSVGATATANATDLVRPSDWNSAHNFFNTISGNTLGTSTASGTNLAFGATGGLSLSHSTGAGAATLWVSAPNPMGFSAGSQSASTGTLVFSNSNGVTFGMSGSSRITASVETSYRASNDAIGLNTAKTNATWTVNSSGLSFDAGGYAGTGTSKTGAAALTLNSNGLQFNGASLAGTTTGFTGANLSASITLNTSGMAMSMSVAAPGAATLSAFAVSNTTQSSSGTIPGSALSFQGVGGVSVGISNGSVVVQGPDLSSISATGALSASSNGSTISLGVGTVTASIIGNTTQTSTGSVNLNALVFSGAGGASLGISAGSIIVSGATGGAGGGVAISAGTQSASTGTMVFSNSNGVTFGMSGSSRITASVAAPDGGVFLSAAGSSQSAGAIVFSNSNGVTFGMNGSTITATVTPGAAAGIGALGASNTTYTSGTVSLVAGAGAITVGSDTGQRISFAVPATSSLIGMSGISLSTNGSTISIYQGPVLSRFLYEPPGASSAGSAMTQGSMTVQRVVLPEPISLTRVDIPIQISLASSATANTGNLLISSGLVIYSANGSTLNPIAGAFGTTTYSHASNTANFNSITGPRWASFPIATALSPGEYFVGVQLSTNNNSSIGTATTAIAATISIQHGAIYTASQWAEFGAVTATSINMRPFVGVAASVTATGQTQQMSNITQTGTALMRANIPVGFRA